MMCLITRPGHGRGVANRQRMLSSDQEIKPFARLRVRTPAAQDAVSRRVIDRNAEGVMPKARRKANEKWL